MVQGEPIPEDDTGDDVSTPEPTADTEGADTGNEPESPEASPKPQSGESSSQGADNGGDIMISPGSGLKATQICIVKVA